MTGQPLDASISAFRRALTAAYPAVAFAFQPVQADLPLFPSEAALLSPNAVEKRRREFAAGRAAARMALRQLGLGQVAIGKGPRGQPLWPASIIGSITHTDQLAVAAAAHKASHMASRDGIGIDLERNTRFHPDIADAILTPMEHAAMGQDAVDLGRYFSAKESTYKAIFDTLNKVIGFQDVALTFNSDQSQFSAAAATPFSAQFAIGVPFLRGHVFQSGDMILSIAVFG